MSFYINTATGEYPIMEGAIREKLKNTSFPTPFRPPLPYKEVINSPIPPYNKLIQVAIEGKPTLSGDTYHRSYTIVDKLKEFTDSNGTVHTKAEQEAEALAIDLNEQKEAKRKQLAALRYIKETTGVTFNGLKVATDRPSQAMLTGAYTTVQINPNAIIDWKGDSGWIQLDAAAIGMLSQAVSSHVQACFTNEKVLSDAIDSALDIASLALIDLNAGWPV